MTAWAVAVGLAFGSGAWLVVIRSPAMRATRFADRVAPQLRTGRPEARLLEDAGEPSAFGPLATIFAPLLRDLLVWVNRVNPVGRNLEDRLGQAGLRMTPTDFRASQLVWAAGGFAATVVWSVLAAGLGTVNWFVAGVLILVGTVGGYVLREWFLGEQVQRRRRRILSQFPAIAELFALAVAAGESTTGAIERIARTAEGDLADEFKLTLSGLRSGQTLSFALRAMSRRVDLAAMGRFVDALTVAIERGTPIADVVRAQAQDVRDAAKRELMETAGKKEIGMLVPVVFGVLPLTVAFAVFPGLSLIDLSL
ncbi:type II secretion system F family protein [Zhihengliuella sp.]|uniref:type II secretion system F family protein n=1 Tax=Zhihengliuella sp. TaxID=1954483 RepID=UPI0028113D33|nr:type II secretion system F family protein [Zhihengliuella sp.]